MASGPYRRALASVAALAILAGCASTPKTFYANPRSVGNLALCKTEKGASARSNPTFRDDVRAELVRRGLHQADCDKLIRKEHAAIAAALLVGAAAYAAAESGGGGGGGSGTVTDYEWDWDEFYNHEYRLVWVCRGVQTGQFAEEWHCNGKPKTDYRWPGLQAPK